MVKSNRSYTAEESNVKAKFCNTRITTDFAIFSGEQERSMLL